MSALVLLAILPIIILSVSSHAYYRGGRLASLCRYTSSSSTLHSSFAPREPTPVGRGEFPEWDDTEAYLDDPYETDEMVASNEMTPSIESITALAAMYNNNNSSSSSSNNNNNIVPISVGSFKTEFTRSSSSSGDDERETWDENPPYFDEKEVMSDDDYSGFFKPSRGGSYGEPNDMNLPPSSDLNARADILGVESGAYKSTRSNVKTTTLLEGSDDSTTVIGNLKRIGDALKNINITLFIIGTINILIQVKTFSSTSVK